MEPIVKNIHSLLLKKGKTLAVAESCTGGLLSKLLTDRPNASKYFISGIIAYSNQTKIKLLNVAHRLLAQKGAVSAEVASQMALSVRKISGSDFGIGITGIAGPSGASPGKPIGTVYICAASKNRSICRRFKFTGSRSAIRNKSASRALKLLKNLL